MLTAEVGCDFYCLLNLSMTPFFSAASYHFLRRLFKTDWQRFFYHSEAALIHFSLYSLHLLSHSHMLFLSFSVPSKTKLVNYRRSPFSHTPISCPPFTFAQFLCTPSSCLEHSHLNCLLTKRDFNRYSILSPPFNLTVSPAPAAVCGLPW